VQTRYLTTVPAPDRRLRLFCFHHAGGAASIFRRWPAALGPEIQVLAVQLPGREERLREPLPPTMDALVEQLDAQLDGALREPYAFYGHSMGARVAHHLAQHRSRHGASPPRALLVGASKAPHLPVPLLSMADASERRLIEAMVDIGGLSPTLLSYPDWVQAAVRLIRQDLRLCATESGAGHRALPCPIVAFTGDADPVVTPDEAGDWDRYTSAGCRVRLVAGNHFFLQEPDEDFAAAVRGALGTTAAIEETHHTPAHQA
jgi:surfactin synthase thioesterase subunit